MTGVERISYVSNYFLKVIIMVNFRSIVHESFSAKCSNFPCGHFECYFVIRNKDERFVDVVGDRREPRWYRWNEVIQMIKIQTWMGLGTMAVWLRSLLKIIFTVCILETFMVWFTFHFFSSTSLKIACEGGELKIMINLIDRGIFIGSVGWKWFNFNVGKSVFTQGQELGFWWTIFEESCLQFKRCTERK